MELFDLSYFFGFSTALLIGVVLILVSGCSTVGRGQTSLVQESTNDTTLTKYFPQYFVQGNKKILAYGDYKPLSDNKINRLLIERYGNAGYSAAALGFTVRDRTKLPPLIPVDVGIPGKLFDFYSEDNKSSVEERIALEDLIYARVNNVPDMKRRTTLHHVEDGVEVHYLYPRLYFDFSSSLRSPMNSDRFAYLGLLVRLKTCECNVNENTFGDSVRIADFWPKDADLVEYTRGTLTQKAQMDAKLTYGSSSENSTTTTAGTEDAKTTVVDNSTNSPSAGAELAYSFSDTYVNELKDAFERRTTGLFEDGKVFFAEFRAIQQKRIGGTYGFDLMLEVPASIESIPDHDANGANQYYAKPIVDEVKADVFLVGVVRHVSVSGKTGTLVRVPEPTNDIAVERVTLERLPETKLWRFNGLPYHAATELERSVYRIIVISNISNARYLLRDTATGEVIDTGSGQKSEFDVVLGKKARTVKIEFLDHILGEKQQDMITLTAPDSDDIEIPADTETSYGIVGETTWAGQYSH